jgi:hypothetical protein
MTKRTKIAMATMFTALIVAGAAPGASAEEQRSVGTTAYRTVMVVTETQYGSVAVRVVNRAVEAALRRL